MHKKLGQISIDIFTDALYYKKTSQKEKEELSKLIHNIYNRPKYKFTQIFYLNKHEKIKNRMAKTFENEVLEGNIPDISSTPSITRYIDFPHGQKILVYDWETIFPLKEIEYEGLNFPCPNQPEKAVEIIYGSDYMKPRGDCYPRHANSTPDTETEKALDEFISDFSDKL